MQFDTTSFRARYRAGIKPGYNAWLHGGFVLLFGTLCIGFLASRITNPSLWEWLTVPLALIFYNWGEYKIHKNLGHVKHRFSKLFYQRHTGDHHSFFAYGQMMHVTYDCTPLGTGSRFTRTVEYRFDHPIGRLANRLFVRKRLEKDSADLLKNLGAVAEQRIPASPLSERDA